MEYGPHDKVEVSFDDIWFPATVLYCMSENTYMVQYLVRKEGGENVLQKTTVGLQHIRPTPPEHKSKPHFHLFDRVEAYYDRGWTSGIITDIKDKNFMISLKRANKEMIFSESNLRPRMEWVDGRWIEASESTGKKDNGQINKATEPVKRRGRPPKTPHFSRGDNKSKASARTAEGTNGKQCNTQQFFTLANDVMGSPQDNVPFQSRIEGHTSKSGQMGGRNDPAGLVIEPMVAEKDASHSRPVEKSKIMNATEITASTDRRTDAATKTKSKQNASENLKTPTSIVSQTENESRSPNEKVLTDSHSRPSKNSKIESTAGITTSTDCCETDTMKTRSRSRPNASQEQKGPTSSVYQTAVIELESPINPSLKNVNCSPDDQVSTGKKINGQINKATEPVKRRGRPPKTPHFSRGDNKSKASARTAEGTNGKQCNTEHFVTFTNDVMGSPQDNVPFQSHIEGHTSKSVQMGQRNDPAGLVIEKQSTVADNDASHSRPSKKSKMVNATELTASTDRRSDAAKTETKSKPNASENLMTPTSTVSQDEHESHSLNEKAKQPTAVARPSKKSKIKNAAEITTNTDCCEIDAMKTRSRSKQNASQEPKVPASIVHQTAVIALESPINPSLENGSSNQDDKVAIGKKDGKINKTTEPIKRRGRPPKTPHSSKEDNKSKASARTAEGTNRKQNNTEHFVTLANDMMGSPQDNVPFQSHIGGHTSTSVQTGQRNDPPGLVIECPTNRQREHMESFTDPICDGVSLGETVVQAVAIDSSPILPFTKTVDLWNPVESMEVFQSFPQKPHFRPLERSSENTREGLAIANMITFCNIANSISELGIDLARSDMEKTFKDLDALEDHGFNVNYHRDLLYDLIVRKEKLVLVQKDLEELEQSLMVSKSKKAEFDEVVNDYNKKSMEIEARREELVPKKEIRDAAIAVGQSSLDRISNLIKSLKSDMEESAAPGY